MQIEFLKVAVEDKGKYKLATMTYKQDGKPRSIGVLSFSEPYPTILAAKQGDIIDVEFFKNDKGFWNLKSATATGNSVEAGAELPSKQASPAKITTSGQWETREERAARQVYIVRQSTLNVALEFLKAQGKLKFSEDDVKKVAKTFEQYVFDTTPTTPEVTNT